MPSACLKPEKKGPVEGEDAMKQCIIVVDKKVRNLEKRKGKLESYREKARQGDELNTDQKEAISNYDAVLRNLEFARELQKQFCEIQEKAEKLLKRRAKFEKQDRHNEEVARIQELLQVQSLLDNMGADDVRADFKTGKKGAVTLSEESLNQLDELYKLISPSRDGEESYTSQLTQAADHIVNFLDAKDKEVAGTTYKNLKDLIRQINECGYFDKAVTEEEQTTADQAEKTETKTEKTEEPAAEMPAEEDKEEEEDVVGTAEPQANHTTTTIISSSSLETQSTIQDQQIHTTPELQSQQLAAALPNPSLQTPPAQEVYEEEQMARPRAISEIVSSVQGSFDFLQDSEIDPQQKVKKPLEGLHVDPAVVAARTLTGSSLHAATDTLSQSFGSAATTNTFLEDPQQPAQYQQSTKNQSVSESSLSQSQAFSDALTAPSQPQSSQFGQGSTFDADMEAKWSQGMYSTSDSVKRSWGEQTSGVAGSGVSSSTGGTPSWGDQTSSTSHTTPSAWSTGGQGPTEQTQTAAAVVSDPPAPIPMPPSQSASLTAGGATTTAFSGGENVPSFSQVTSANQETKSSLNPNADIFSSTLYSNQSAPGFSQDGGANEYDASNQMSSKQDRYGQSDMSGGYQSQGYRGRRDYDSRGGARGGRGGPRGSGGITNGYGGGRGGSRGGSSYRGDDRRGGGGQRGGSGGAGTRGGPSFQGYPPRSNYQPEGYQGSSSSSSTYGLAHDSGAGFTNKWGGQRGGGMRGGNRGGSGPRGGSRGTYSRPTSAHNQ